MAIHGRGFPSKAIYGHGPIPEAAPTTAVYGSDYSARSSFGAFGFPVTNVPFIFTCSVNQYGTVPLPTTAVWGDTYQPRASHVNWNAQPPLRDNPSFAFTAAPGTAVFGDSYLIRRGFKPSSISYAQGSGFDGAPPPPTGFYPSELYTTSAFLGYGVATSFSILGRGWGSNGFVQAAAPATAVWGDGYKPWAKQDVWNAQPPRLDNPPLPTTTLWGDTYRPRAKHDAWQTTSVNDNPAWQPIIFWGDSYRPRASHAGWNAQPPWQDNPSFAFTAAPANAIYGDSFQIFSQFPGSGVATSFSILSRGWGSVFFPPFVQAPVARTANRRHWRRTWAT